MDLEIFGCLYTNSLMDRLDLKVTFSAHHVNEKIKRIHIQLKKISGYPKLDPETLENPPFKFTAGIAEFNIKQDLGKGLLVPIVHKRLIEPAEFKDNLLRFKVPRLKSNHKVIGEFFSSLSIKAASTSSDPEGSRHAPEYIHVRHI